MAYVRKYGLRRKRKAPYGARTARKAAGAPRRPRRVRGRYSKFRLRSRRPMRSIGSQGFGIVLRNNASSQTWKAVTLSKTGQMTYGFELQDGGGTNPMEIGDYIRNDARALQWATKFMYVRVPWIKVTLIPEKYFPDGGNDPISDYKSYPARLPSIAFINDDGEIARFLTGPDGTMTNPTIAQAMSYGGKKFKTRLFNKKMTFYIKPYARAQEGGYNINDGRPGNPGTSFNKYISANRWVPTQALGGRLAHLWIPRGNLLWGLFDDTLVNEAGFKYKTILEWKMVFKQPYADV